MTTRHGMQDPNGVAVPGERQMRGLGAALQLGRRQVSLAVMMAVIIVLAAALLLIAKNLFIDNAVVFHDEYLYKVWSDSGLRSADILARNLAPILPNRLYLTIYSVGTDAGSNFYDIAQLMNVGFWVMGLLLALRLALSNGIKGGELVLYGVALTMLPLSTYTKYFMPESMFLACFLASVGLVLQAARDGSYRACLVTGVSIGLMYYVKPHAVFVLGVDILFLLASRRSVAMVGVLLVGFVLAYLAGHLLLPSPGGSSTGLGVYSQMLRMLLDHLMGYGGGMKHLTGDLAYVLAGHGMLFLAFFSVPLTASLALAFPRLGWVEDSDIGIREKCFTAYLLICTAIMISVASMFTVMAGEIGRIHSRYYFFIYPLWILQCLLLRRVRFTRPGKVVASLLSVTAIICLAVFGGSYSAVLPVAHVSDGPEWGFVFSGTAMLFALLGCLSMGAQVSIFTRRGPWLLVGAIMLVSLVSTVSVAWQQKHLFRGAFVDGRDAVAVEQFLGTEEMNRAIVVGTGRDQVSKFLFFLHSTPYVTYASGGTPINGLLRKNPGVTRLVLLSNDFVAPGHAQCFKLGERVRICSINATDTP